MPQALKDTFGSSAVIGAVAGSRRVFLYVALFSGVVNILALTGPLYMMQVYDRVLASRSVPTLAVLSIAALFLYAMMGVLDAVRARILVRIGARFDDQLAERVFRAVVAMPLRVRNGADALQCVRDLDAVRGFICGQGPIAVFDMPWLPIYLLLVYLLHPALGLLATAGALALCLLTYLTDRQTKAPAHALQREGARRLSLAEASRRNAEVLKAMGLSSRMARAWLETNARYLRSQTALADIGGGYGTASKIARMMLQSALLGLGALLVIQNQATGGVMLAASLIAARALAPIETAIGNWKGFVAARHGARRLDDVLAAFPVKTRPLPLPAPHHQLSVESIFVAPPGLQKPILHNVSFALQAGQALGVIGPSAAGKSTLARALIGVWPLSRGEVRLDGAAIGQWWEDDLGRHIGYLPQDIELFDGSIGQNIARFDESAAPDAIIAAAKAAGVHEMIVRLQDGYDMRVGEGGAALSAGQRQRIGLARALFGDPFLVVLDEPNSNLDSAGEGALTAAIKGVRARGGIVVVIAHRPSAIAAVDVVAVINAGQIVAFGPKDEVLRNAVKPVADDDSEAPAPARPAIAAESRGREGAA